MFLIPGVLISIVTFPGVIVHELAHQLFCYLRRVPVYEVKYFQMKNPCGYVSHEPSDSPLTNFLISVGPFIVNTVVGALILISASIEISVFGMFAAVRDNNSDTEALILGFSMLIAYWLGISILMHAFPSSGDARVLIESVLKNKKVGIPVKILVAPVIGLIYIGVLGSVVWLDLGYGVLISFLLPKLIAPFL